eukprot:scpid37444/ scgid1703/ 
MVSSLLSGKVEKTVCFLVSGLARCIVSLVSWYDCVHFPLIPVYVLKRDSCLSFACALRRVDLIRQLSTEPRQRCSKTRCSQDRPSKLLVPTSSAVLAFKETTLNSPYIPDESPRLNTGGSNGVGHYRFEVRGGCTAKSAQVEASPAKPVPVPSSSSPSQTSAAKPPCSTAVPTATPKGPIGAEYNKAKNHPQSQDCPDGRDPDCPPSRLLRLSSSEPVNVWDMSEIKSRHKQLVETLFPPSFRRSCFSRELITPSQYRELLHMKDDAEHNENILTFIRPTGNDLDQFQTIIDVLAGEGRSLEKIRKRFQEVKDRLQREKIEFMKQQGSSSRTIHSHQNGSRPRTSYLNASGSSSGARRSCSMATDALEEAQAMGKLSEFSDEEQDDITDCDNKKEADSGKKARTQSVITGHTGVTGDGSISSGPSSTSPVLAATSRVQDYSPSAKSTSPLAGNGQEDSSSSVFEPGSQASSPAAASPSEAPVQVQTEAQAQKPTQASSGGKYEALPAGTPDLSARRPDENARIGSSSSSSRYAYAQSHQAYPDLIDGKVPADTVMSDYPLLWQHLEDFIANKLDKWVKRSTLCGRLKVAYYYEAIQARHGKIKPICEETIELIAEKCEKLAITYGEVVESLNEVQAFDNVFDWETSIRAKSQHTFPDVEKVTVN